MSASKAALKAISAAVRAQKYDEAVQQCQQILVADPQNYQALIFLGFALDRQTKYHEAEKAYVAATGLKGSDPQAWQGLVQLYEKMGADRLDRYQPAALNLAGVYQNLDDKYRCQDVVDKFLAFAKTHGTRMQHKHALEMILPTSPLYDYLEGRVSHPSHTYQIMAQITEFEENERINKEIGERRTRLGATISQVTVDVKREVLRNSDLEDLYAKIIDWSNDDEIRRQYEEKLLQRSVEALTVLLPGGEKNNKRSKVFKLASDMVIIKHPYKLAWDVAIEWQDVQNIQDLDANLLREYIVFFPTSGLGQVLRGFMTSEISLFPPPPPPPESQPQSRPAAASDDSEDDDKAGGAALDPPLIGEDRLLVMAEGMSDAHKSIIAHRLMGEYYQYLDEHESVVDLMRNGRRLITDESNLTGLPFDHSYEAIISLLGTALVFYQSPKNHPEAKSLFEELLTKNPTSTPALMGVGLIYEEEEDYPSAIDFLDRALERDSSNVRIKAEVAWVRALNGDYAKGRHDLEACLPIIDPQDPRSRDLIAQTQYRVGVCMWNIDTSKASRKARDGAYSLFIAALKSSLNFAPAYTSLGVFYADYAKDKKRARKCFQKAFELSPSEVQAAERLSRMFAEQGEWELVGAVAQRVIDSGKVKPAPGSKKKGFSWPFAALGVAELNKQDYAKSIVSFQSALRIRPNDYHSWVGLGESYHSSGRYMAAMKAFEHAEKFEHDIEQQKSGEVWFAKYMLSNVKRELGDFDDAIQGYKSVLNDRPAEFGVSIALLQTLVESAWDGIDKGLFGQAVHRSTETICIALTFTHTATDAFSLWKVLGDACAVFSWVRSRLSDFPGKEMRQLLVSGDHKDAYGVFTEVDGVEANLYTAQLRTYDAEYESDLTNCLHSAILCYKRAIHSSAHDTHAQAVAYYNLGWMEFRAHVCVYEYLKRRTTTYLKAAVRCFKRAIELEAGNSEFWNSLGVVASELNPKVAQHSFVRSLFLNERNAQVWTNLGALYLLQNDIQLANDAFTRAQSTDPDFAHAWVGQGLIALMTDNAKEADHLFTHAMEISESASLITKTQYSQSIFDRLLASQTATNKSDLSQPLFALKQLQAMTPSDLPHQHLSMLLSERIDNVSSAMEILEAICARVEADYEITESPDSLSRFSLAKADLARIQLEAGSYSDAIDSGETALQLSTEDAGNELTVEGRRRCRLSAHLTVGLAQYYSNNLQAALQYFQPALEESNRNPDAVCLLAQVLWAMGNDESRAEAQERLFESVESHPDHVQSILLLSVIALLSDDQESLDAVSATLQDLRARSATTDREQAQISEILQAIAEFSEDNNQKVLTEVQTQIFLHPHRPYGWVGLATIGGDDRAADMALRTALRAVPPRGNLEASDLSEVFASTGRIGDTQMAIMVAPWKQTGWDAFGDVMAGLRTTSA